MEVQTFLLAIRVTRLPSNRYGVEQAALYSLSRNGQGLEGTRIRTAR